MPERPDLRQISGNIREALDGCDRETLLDMLTFVFKEYVVEGPPPLLSGQVERIADLEGLSFAQLVRTLQTRLDLPELALFQVDGEQVSVRVQGVLTPLEAARGRAAAEAAMPAQPARPAAGVHVVEMPMTRPRSPAASANPQAYPQAEREAGSEAQAGGAQAGGRQGAGQQPAAGTAPPPRRGLSVRGQATGDAAPGSTPPRSAGAQPAAQGPTQSAGGAQPAGQQPGQARAAEPRPGEPGAAPAEAPRQPGTEEDIASTRFSLLELD